MNAPQRGSRAWSTVCAAWQLGHPNDMTTGTTRLTDLAPEHAHENMSAGATAGNHARTSTTQPTWAL